MACLPSGVVKNTVVCDLPGCDLSPTNTTIFDTPGAFVDKNRRNLPFPVRIKPPKLRQKRIHRIDTRRGRRKKLRIDRRKRIRRWRLRSRSAARRGRNSGRSLCSHHNGKHRSGSAPCDDTKILVQHVPSFLPGVAAAFKIICFSILQTSQQWESVDPCQKISCSPSTPAQPAGAYIRCAPPVQ